MWVRGLFRQTPQGGGGEYEGGRGQSTMGKGKSEMSDDQHRIAMTWTDLEFGSDRGLRVPLWPSEADLQ